MAAKERDHETFTTLSSFTASGNRKRSWEKTLASSTLRVCKVIRYNAHYEPARSLAAGVMRLARLLTYGVLGKS